MFSSLGMVVPEEYASSQGHAKVLPHLGAVVGTFIGPGLPGLTAWSFPIPA